MTVVVTEGGCHQRKKNFRLSPPPRPCRRILPYTDPPLPSPPAAAATATTTAPHAHVVVTSAGADDLCSRARSTDAVVRGGFNGGMGKRFNYIRPLYEKYYYKYYNASAFSPPSLIVRILFVIARRRVSLRSRDLPPPIPTTLTAHGWFLFALPVLFFFYDLSTSKSRFYIPVDRFFPLWRNDFPANKKKIIRNARHLSVYVHKTRRR